MPRTGQVWHFATGRSLYLDERALVSRLLLCGPVAMAQLNVRNVNQRWAPQRGAYILGGKYQLEKPIGEGGMGSVWRAHQVALQRPVAVKFVKVDEPHMVERFLRETRVAASIRNPHVIDMLDFGTTPTGQPVLVMELLEGESLEDVLARRGVSALEAVSVMAQVLIALEAVHAAGIVHGDLKPANVFLSADGTDESFVRLIDFGIAYSIDPASSLRRGRNGTDLRTICGTPEYMAPELAECLPDVDARADVYGAGVMLYELLAGALPFEGEHSGATLFKVMDGKYEPLVSLRPDIPELAAIVTNAMARDRADRPQTAHKLRMLLLDAVPMLSGSLRLLANGPAEADTIAVSARQQVPTLPEVLPSRWRTKKFAALTLLTLALLTGILLLARSSLSAGDVPAQSVEAAALLPVVVTPTVVLPALELMPVLEAVPIPEPMPEAAPMPEAVPAPEPVPEAVNELPISAADEVPAVSPAARRPARASVEVDVPQRPRRPRASGLRRTLDF